NEPIHEHLSTFERIHVPSLVATADDVVRLWSGDNSSCGWLPRLENASEIGIARFPPRIRSPTVVEPVRHLLLRVEDASGPTDPGNRVDRRYFHRLGRLERVRHAVPGDGRERQAEHDQQDQNEDLDAR